MGKAGKTLIYGGANLGLMECVARAVKENGGTVIGVVPAKLEEKGSVSTLLDEVIHTRNLSDRKDVITEKSEILVALPGGVGTLDEIFHVIAAASIGYHQKKVIFYNEYGFYNELLAALKTLEDKGFARQSFSTYYETSPQDGRTGRPADPGPDHLPDLRRLSEGGVRPARAHHPAFLAGDEPVRAAASGTPSLAAGFSRHAGLRGEGQAPHAGRGAVQLGSGHERQRVRGFHRFDGRRPQTGVPRGQAAHVSAGRGDPGQFRGVRGRPPHARRGRAQVGQRR